MLAAATRVDLVNEVHQIPPKEWRFREVGLHQKPAQVFARYRVEGGSRQVRIAIMRRDELDRLWKEQPHEVIDESSFGAEGSLTTRLLGPGDYVLLVDNRGDAPARVHLYMSLEFAVVTQLPRDRQLVVIALSFAGFLGIVTWSAHRLLRNIRQP